MKAGRWFTACLIVVATLRVSAFASADDPSTVELVVKSGTPLRVALDETIRIKRVGQPVVGTLIEPIYAYDRIVLPAGSRVTGRVAELDGPPKLVRARAMAGGDFSPKRHAVLQFDTVLRDGEPLAIQTVVANATASVTRRFAAEPRTDSRESDRDDDSVRGQVRERVRDAAAAAKARASDTLAAIKRPGRMERLKAAVIDRLPYHPQYLSKGTVFDAELQAPLSFGAVSPADEAPEAARPAPSTVLKARLVTALDSGKASRGAPLEAVVTEPVFSSDGRLILAEGTRLAGEVTFVRRARRFHRNGQMRFLFESVQPPGHIETTMLGSLHAIDASADEHVEVDEEGGAKATNSKTRFIAPALAALALTGAVHQHRRNFDNDGDDVGGVGPMQTGSPGSRTVGGFLGFGLIGIAVSRISPPVGIALAAVGVARTVYTNILGRGQELKFPADTPVQVQLAPGLSGGR